MEAKPTYKRWWITIFFDNIYTKESCGVLCISHFLHVACAYICFCIWLWFAMFRGELLTWVWPVIKINFIGFFVNPLPWIYRYFRHRWLKKHHPEGVWGHGTIDGMSEDEYAMNNEYYDL